MAKSMKGKITNKKYMKKRSIKKHRKSNVKKSSKKHGSSRKNIKRVSLRNFSNAHKRHISHHRHRALHNTGRPLHGGKKNKICGCGCGRNCGNGCGCARNCGCGCSKNMKGGMVSSPASGPVGYAWNGGNESTWPGVAANHGINTHGNVMSNHFAVSPNGIAVGGIDLARSTSDDNNINPPMNGGKRKRRGINSQKGGFFQEIVNLGRGVQGGINGGYFNLIGKQQPLSENPYPTVQPIANTGCGNNTVMPTGNPPDVEKIYMNANKNVAAI